MYMYYIVEWYVVDLVCCASVHARKLSYPSKMFSKDSVIPTFHIIQLYDGQREQQDNSI